MSTFILQVQSWNAAAFLIFLSIGLSLEEPEHLHFICVFFSCIRMLTQRQIELRITPQYGARMCEFQESPLAVVGTHTRMACTVERRTLDHHMETHFVDASAAELLCFHDFVCPLDILGEQIESETMFSVSNGLQDIVNLVIRERNDRKKR